jgi:ankyrin repeat protein
MPVLPARPNLEHLKKEAKALLQGYQQGEPNANARMRALGIATAPDQTKLADAQHAVARDYGFANWTALKGYVESIDAAVDPRKALIGAVNANDVGKARSLFERYPVLRQTINDPAPELPFGGRPIGHVAKRKQREMVDLFLEHGADINARSDWEPGSWGVLDGADPDFAEFLISRGARLDAHSAAHLDKLEELRAIVAADPNVVHARGGDGQTPLHFARSVAVADFLLDSGAEIDALDIDHEGTPAQWMISDRTELARHLVRRGAKEDLFLAIALGDIHVVRRYLDANPAAVQMTVTDEYLPTQGPLCGGHIYLWSLGRNKSMLEIAEEFKHDDVYKLLLERSPDQIKLLEAFRLGDDRLVRELLARNPGLIQNMPNQWRKHLVIAVQEENPNAVRSMLEAGWPTDGRGQDDGTALHWAGFLGNAEITRELLRHRADVDVVEGVHKGTPLQWTLYGSVHGWRCDRGDFIGVVDALLKAGATLPNPVTVASDELRDFLAKYTKR